ncbi:uncharacterized protein LOC114282431 isoform X6 [Camellia sinensis]|uniref:uncharacterized protein LOC114282431 isoform X6 n=1 Tax=Camellia sinensis TaxID=4442 RepID=UPI001036DBA7|nr:uncharacterized protein LOC114282431 isoform X6 [Camellia sinensis]
MEENQAPTTPSRPISPPPSSWKSTQSKLQNPSTESSRPTPPPPSVTRLWRPAAQRNLRNQWTKLASYRQQWYMNDMELGVLSDMPNIRKKACWKLLKQQELHRRKLLSFYKDMVAAVVHVVNASRSMRSFIKGTSSPLVQFSNFSEDKNDNGDGGGIPVFAFWSISNFEEFANELVQMFTLELNLKRLLVVELLSISSEEVPINSVSWLDELYPGEFDDLCICGLYSKELFEPVHPKIKGWKSDMTAEHSNCQPDHEVLQIYLTTWLAEVNIDTYRIGYLSSRLGPVVEFETFMW